MVNREQIIEAIKTCTTIYLWRDERERIADALLALLPTAEGIGHAACEVMQPRGGRIVGSYREIGTAILEELKNQKEAQS